MVERARAAEDSPADAPVAVPATTAAPVGNRQTMAQLADGAGPARSDEVTRLSGAAGNRAVANWLGAGPVVAQASPAPPRSPTSPPFQGPQQSPQQSPVQPPFQSPQQSPFQGPQQNPFQLPGPTQSPMQSPAPAPVVPAGRLDRLAGRRDP